MTRARKSAPGATFETLTRLDRRLESAGIPPLTPWWSTQLRAFYTHPTARTLVARVGRGGAKSHTSAKVALNETIFGAWEIPRGEIHRFVFVSVDKTEASQRLRLLCEFLDALQVPHHSAGDEIILRDLPRGFKVCAAAVGGVSGYRAFGAALDEVAKWADGDTYSDPADEVAASIAAMTITHAGRARQLLVSSPWSVDDFHARRFERGDTDDQMVIHAPTWIANPSVTEEDTRATGVDPDKWRREYAAIPGDTETTAFPQAAVAAAFERDPEVEQIAGERIVLIDASSLKHDDFAYAIAAPAVDGGIALLEVGGVKPGAVASLADVVSHIASRAELHGATRVFGDQREDGGLSALFLQKGLFLTASPWSPQSKSAAGALLLRMLRENHLTLPTHTRLRSELLNQRARLRPNGLVEYPTNGRDYISLLFALATAIENGLVPFGGFALSEYWEGIAMLSDEETFASFTRGPGDPYEPDAEQARETRATLAGFAAKRAAALAAGEIT